MQFWTRWSADMAYWGGVSTGPNRFSMLFPSHGAAAGLLRRILGKWEMRHVIHEVRLLRQGHRLTSTSNEINDFGNGSAVIFSDGPKRTLRTTSYLCDVEYAICSSIVLTHHAREEDTLEKFHEMFFKRASMGQFFGRHPYMGIKECSANYEFVEDARSLPESVKLTQDFGLCFYDRDWDNEGPRTAPLYFAPLSVRDGVVKYPTWREVRNLGIRRDS